MNTRTMTKTFLLQACGSAAIALGIVGASTGAHAQAFQATPNVVQGSVVIDRATPGQDTITVVGLDAVVDWTPDEDINGDALVFLPAANTAIFQSQPGDPNFAIINRILPATNGNIVLIDGTVISQLQQLSGPPVTGGYVMFYSSTGMIIGQTAVFDTGGLVLTTLSPDINSFAQFAAGTGSLNLTGVSNDTSLIQINGGVSGGASITGSEDGSFLLVAAPQIFMGGTVDMNGSVAYVAAQETSISYADGLFDIIIPTGTVVGTAFQHTGITGGPASNGGTDNHVIYGVTQAQTNPATMLLSGDLGFQPAINATTDNGDIILSANYDVLGRDLAGGTAGSDTFFDGRNETSGVQADIFILDPANITSSITAVGSHITSMQATSGGPLIVDGDVTLVGRTLAEIFTADGTDIDINGDVLVSARNFAPVVGTVGQPGELDAFGGTAQIYGDGGGVISITGNVEVNANAVSGVATVDLIGGAGQGGIAYAGAQNGSLLIIGGDANVFANASPFQLPGLNSAGDQTGGSAQIAAFEGGQVDISGDARVEAMASAVSTTGTAITAVSNAFGGNVQVSAIGAGSPARVDIFGNLTTDTSALGILSEPIGGAGGTATGGVANIISEDSSAVTVGIGTIMRANAAGADNANGTGGAGVGGFNGIGTNTNGTIDFGNNVSMFANGTGGSGISGGDGFGGVSRVLISTGLIDFFGGLNANAQGRGGTASANFGFGGDGGAALGGHASIQATGTLTENATINISQALVLRADAIGGPGGPGDGSTIAPGNGGDAIAGSIPNDAFGFPGNVGGAFALAGGDRGNIFIGGNTNLLSTASGGRGGTAGIGQLGGTGGNAIGGDGSIGTIGAGVGGSVALGTLTAGTVIVNVNAFAGDGGFDNTNTTFTGLGGNGTGGSALVQTRYGQVSLGNVTLAGSGFGGDGSTGGDGFGDQAGVFISNAEGGTISISSLLGFADGNGGTGTDGDGGNGTAGAAFVGFQGGDISIGGTTTLNATGTGGPATNGNGGTGTGGIADLADFSGVPGTGDFQGTATLTASGIGGNALSAGFDGGTGIGGDAYILSQAGSLLNAPGTVFITGFGRGGDAVDGTGGLAQGGSATAEAIGAGAQVIAGTIQMNGGSIAGSSSSGTGGDAFGGGSTAAAENGGTLTVGTQLVVNTVATAGNGVTGGSALGGESLAIASDNGSFAVGDLDINANADTAASSGGTIEGGTVELFVSGPAALTANTAVMSANADGAAGGTATGGSATLSTETSGLPGTGAVNIGTMVFEVSGTGAASNFAGDFDVGALNGTIVFQDLFGFALGPDGAGDTSSLEANIFDIAIINSGLIDSDGDLEFITGNGGLIVGGTGPTDLTASFDFRTSGLISIIGDNDNLTSFGALSMILESSDIDIPLGARFGAVDLTFFSNNTAHGAVIGGTTDENGWTMTQDEAARIEATNVSFDGPQTLGGDPYDVEVRDITIFGSQDDGVSSVSLFSAGTLGIVGQVDFQFAGPSDLLQVFAADRIDVLVDVVSGGPTGGAIFMTDANDNLSGTIDMFAPSIFAVMPDTLSQLLSDPEFSGLADILAAEQGFSEPQAFIAADTVSLFAEDYIYTQNWGANGIFSGVAVGPGGFTLQQDGDTLPNLLNAIVYGVQVNGLNDLTTNSDFFQITTFNMTPSNHFTSTSTLNNCLIVDGTCGGTPSSGTEGEVEEVVEAVTTSGYTAPPTPVTAEAAALVEESETDSSFGLDFPSLFNPPTVQEQGTVRDPVTSGGDSAAYADSGEDEEEGTQDDL